MFDIAVYFRGAMAVHALRQQVGDRDFFRILRAWTTRRAGGHGTIPQFIGLAERISGQQLDDLFDVWLFTGSKPVLEAAAAAQATASAPSAAGALERARGAERLRR
jgi:aminopeptidase N